MKKLLLAMVVVGLVVGCAKHNTYDTKIGAYTFAEAVVDLGPPSVCTHLGGRSTCSWVTGQGKNWVDKIILTFDERGVLSSGQEKRL